MIHTSIQPHPGPPLRKILTISPHTHTPSPYAEINEGGKSFPLSASETIPPLSPSSVVSWKGREEGEEWGRATDELPES